MACINTLETTIWPRMPLNQDQPHIAQMYATTLFSKILVYIKDDDMLSAWNNLKLLMNVDVNSNIQSAVSFDMATQAVNAFVMNGKPNPSIDFDATDESFKLLLNKYPK